MTASAARHEIDLRLAKAEKTVAWAQAALGQAAEEVRTAALWGAGGRVRDLHVDIEERADRLGELRDHVADVRANYAEDESATFNPAVGDPPLPEVAHGA